METVTSLEAHFKSILPRAKSADIDPQEFQAYFDMLKRKMKRP